MAAVSSGSCRRGAARIAAIRPAKGLLDVSSGAARREPHPLRAARLAVAALFFDEWRALCELGLPYPGGADRAWLESRRPRDGAPGPRARRARGHAVGGMGRRRALGATGFVAGR